MTEPVRLLCTLAIEGPLRELLPICGLAVDAQFGPTKLLVERLGGEAVDLAVLTAEAASSLQAQGEVIDGGRTDLIVSLVGVAVPDDAATPVWADVESFVATLRAAPSIAYSQSGASGLHFLKIIRELGLEDMVAAKATIIPDGFTAALLRDGRATLAVQQVSELLAGGARNIAPLPDAVQARAIFSSVVLERAENPGVAKALADFLASPLAAEAFRRWGLVPLTSD